MRSRPSLYVLAKRKSMPSALFLVVWERYVLGQIVFAQCPPLGNLRCWANGPATFLVFSQTRGGRSRAAACRAAVFSLISVSRFCVFGHLPPSPRGRGKTPGGFPRGGPCRGLTWKDLGVTCLAPNRLCQHTPRARGEVGGSTETPENPAWPP